MSETITVHHFKHEAFCAMHHPVIDADCRTCCLVASRVLRGLDPAKLAEVLRRADEAIEAGGHIECANLPVDPCDCPQCDTWGRLISLSHAIAELRKERGGG